MSKDILVTGSTGFIGQPMVRALRESGYMVDTIDRTKSTEDTVRAGKSLLWGNLDEVDFSKYTAVVHLAGKAHDTRHLSDPSEYEKVNYDLTKTIFDAWNSSNSKSFIFMSTILAVKRETDGKLSEKNEGMPASYYGISKRRAEDYVMENTPIGRNTYILRPALVYGKGLKGNLAKLLRAVEQGMPLPLGAINEKRSYLYIENLNQIVRNLVTDCPPGGIYHLADDEEVSLKQLIDQMAQLKDRRAVNIPVPRVILKAIANLGSLIGLPYNNETHSKLTEELLISNDKIKKALHLEKMPFRFNDGLKSIAHQ